MLSGGKPAVTGSAQRAFSKWQVDEDNSDGVNTAAAAAVGPTTEMVGGSPLGSGPGHRFGLAGSTAAAPIAINSTGAPGNEVRTESNKRFCGHPPRTSTADFGSLPGPAGYGNIPEDHLISLPILTFLCQYFPIACKAVRLGLGRRRSETQDLLPRLQYHQRLEHPFRRHDVRKATVPQKDVPVGLR
jgi:hypothetical protein